MPNEGYCHNSLGGKSGEKGRRCATLENSARFPLSHRYGDDEVSNLIWKADSSRADGIDISLLDSLRTGVYIRLAEEGPICASNCEC